MTSSSVAIVYHSGFGHTRVQAEAVRDGAAAVDGTTAHLIRRRRCRRPLGRARRRRRDHLRVADLHGRRVGTVQGVPRCDVATVGRAALARQAGRRVHQLGRDERRQAGHAAAVRPVRHAARHGLGRPRPAPRQPHQRRVARRPQPVGRVPRRDGAVERRPRPRAGAAVGRPPHRRAPRPPRRRARRPAARRPPRRSSRSPGDRATLRGLRLAEPRSTPLRRRAGGWQSLGR